MQHWKLFILKRISVIALEQLISISVLLLSLKWKFKLKTAHYYFSYKCRRCHYYHWYPPSKISNRSFTKRIAVYVVNIYACSWQDSSGGRATIGTELSFISVKLLDKTLKAENYSAPHLPCGDNSVDLPFYKNYHENLQRKTNLLSELLCELPWTA